MRHHGKVPPTADRPYRVTFVCSGNICRSPMAEAVFSQMIEGAGLADRVDVDSAGTGDWHVGEPADRRALDALRRAGYGGDNHRARQFDAADFVTTDLVVALDSGHARSLRAWAGPHHVDKVVMLRAFDAEVPGDAGGRELDVADPYYGGPEGFAEVLDQVQAAGRGLLRRVQADLAS